MRYISDYCTFESVGRILTKANPGSVPTPASNEYSEYNDFVTFAIRQFSQWITTDTDRVFVPYRHTYTFTRAELLTYRMYKLNYQLRYELQLPDDMLVNQGLTWNAETVLTTTYTEIGSGIYRPFPFDKFLFFKGDAPTNLTEDSQVVDIDGTWGYHTSLQQAYSVVSGESVTIDSSSTSLSVTDADSFETFQYIRLESELLRITARNTSTNVLTVERGVNGTTATEHTAVDVEIYNVLPDIAQATSRGVAWLYQHRNDVSGAIAVADGTVFIDQMPVTVKGTLGKYRRVLFGATGR